MPSTMNCADCCSRLTRFSAERKRERSIWKMMTITIRPPTTGRTPLWPLRTRLIHAVAYSRAVASVGTAIRSRSSGAWSAAVSLSIAGVAVTSPAAARGSFVSAISGRRRRGADPVLAFALVAGGHDLDGAEAVVVRRLSGGDEPAEIEDRDAVGDREHVCQVV